MATSLVAICAGYPALTAQDRMRSVWDGVYTQAQAERGGELYNQQCARCHGRALEGDSYAPQLAGSIFLSDWDGVTLGKLFARVKDMADNNAGSANPEINAAILAYILAYNSFPAGSAELPSDRKSLDHIQFLQTKP